MNRSRIIQDTEVCVIGAGVVGCSIAYNLAESGTAVTVVEIETIGAGTTKATLGLVWVQGKEPAEYMELNLAAARLHAGLAEKFDEDIGLRQPGGLIICLEENQLQAEVMVLQQLAATTGTPYEARVLSAAQVREMEPSVSLEITGGIYSPYDGHVNPFKLLSGMVRLARQRGACFIEHTPVRRILQSDSKVTGVETTRGILRAKSVVIAAGACAPMLLEPLGAPLSLKLERGQILVTAAIGPLIHHPLGLAMRQTVEGNFLLGSTHEHVREDKSTTIKAAHQIASQAIRIVPSLCDVPVIRQFSGTRVIPVDGLPILGPVTSIMGLFIALSHSGITLAPLHGKVIKELILNGKTSVPIHHYRPERFNKCPSISGDK
jgi:sarcosine oxidase subunit beta